MTAPPPLPRRPPSERLAAWLVTGPVGHFWSVTADVATFGARHLARRIAGRG